MPPIFDGYTIKIESKIVRRVVFKFICSYVSSFTECSVHIS